MHRDKFEKRCEKSIKIRNIVIAIEQFMSLRKSYTFFA